MKCKLKAFSKFNQIFLKGIMSIEKKSMMLKKNYNK